MSSSRASGARVRVVNDGSADSNTLDATISYTPVNDAPVLDTASERWPDGRRHASPARTASFAYEQRVGRLSHRGEAPGGLVQFVDLRQRSGTEHSM